MQKALKQAFSSVRRKAVGRVRNWNEAEIYWTDDNACRNARHGRRTGYRLRMVYFGRAVSGRHGPDRDALHR